MNTFRPQHFILQELISEAFFKRWGERSWEWLRPEALITLDQLREAFGPLTVNNWHAGGSFQESGLRDFMSLTGAGHSFHKFGAANDVKSSKIRPVEMQSYILSRPEKFPLLTTLEDAAITKTWLHVDVRNHHLKTIWIVKP